MNEKDEEEKVITAWHTAFKKGTDYDLWGQPVEAIDGYQRLSKQLQKFSTAESTRFTEEQKRILGKIAICLDLRCKALQAPGSLEGVSLDDLKRIETTLETLLIQRSKDFPVDVTAAQLHSQSISNHQFPDLDGEEDNRQGLRVKGSLLPQPLSFGGRPVLTIRIEKIGLKDASQFIDPYMSVYVKDSQGADLTTHQDTPVAAYRQDTYVVFNVDVHVQKTLDSLPPGYAIFFEFKHYKPKKGSVSTRCWAFMESDEIKDGPSVLELNTIRVSKQFGSRSGPTFKLLAKITSRYKKPANYKKRNIRLLTVKPLYLHLRLIISV